MSECNSPRTMPTEPKTITVHLPGSPATKPSTISGAPVFVPFYYASISSFWIHFEADPRKLRPLLKGTGLKPFISKKKALVNLNFENYTAHNGNSLAVTNELEFNVIAYPASRSREIPRISAECFLKGEDQTKLLGNYRIHVPADNRFAVAAGIALFGENKFVANFNYAVPSLNLPTQKTWQYTIKDLSNQLIIDVNADIHKLVPEPANPAAIIDYSMLKGRLIGSRRNLFTIVDHYNLDSSDAKKIKVKVGKSKEAHMARDLSAVLGRAKPIAVQVLQTPPVIAESRAYYPD